MLWLTPPLAYCIWCFPVCSLMGLNGNEPSLSFLSIITVGSAGPTDPFVLLKFKLKPEVVVIDMLVLAPLMILETSALSKTPKSDAKSFSA